MIQGTERQDRRDNDRLIIFTHIPKCAGASILASLIEPNVAEELIYTPRGMRELFWSKRDFRYLKGHFEFGAEKAIHPRNPAKRRRLFRFTILRDPVDQMLSYFFYHRRLRNDVISEEYSEREILEFFRKENLSQNLQTRFCSGVLASRLSRVISKPQALRLAKRNLMCGFDYVGKFECIESVMREVASILSYPPVISHAESTKSFKPVTQGELSSETLRELREINCFDLELYTFAQEKLWKGV